MASNEGQDREHEDAYRDITSTGNSTSAYEYDHDEDEEDTEYAAEEDAESEEEEDNEEDDDDGDDDFQDALGEVEVEVVMEEETGEASTAAGTGAAGTAAGTRTRTSLLDLINGGILTRSQIIGLLSRQDLGRILFADADEDDEYDPRARYARRRGARRPSEPLDPDRFPKVPDEEGQKLMDSGNFGTSPVGLNGKKRIARRVMEREIGIGSRATQWDSQRLMAQEMIPASEPEMIIQYPEPVCCGQFSDDGNFFYACVKDFKVRMYDTSNPYNWKHYKTHTHPFGQWTLTDADLSPDNRWLVFTSLQSTVCFAPTDPSDTGDPYTLDLDDQSSADRRQGGWWNRYSFPIYSVRFSGDGRELIAGTGADSVVVYDIESRRVLHHVRGHDNDVNAVAFADKSSSHIIYSGSDDTTIKVWDRRSMGDGREAGAFVGHIEGLTYIDTKGDGRYILSNAKESSMKLWDLRMAMSTARFKELDPTQYTRNSMHDYRGSHFDDHTWFRHKHDNSLVTYRGHDITRTLIRCHFSPPGSTNSRYVYSGSGDGFVYVWNLDATIAAKIDVHTASQPTAAHLPNSRLRLSRRSAGQSMRWRSLVRDVGWHPNAPLLVASAWNGLHHTSGTATLHSFNEGPEDEVEPRMGRIVNEKLGSELPETYEYE